MEKRDFWTAFLLGIFGFFLVAVTINHPGPTWDEANFIPSSLSYLDWFRQLRSPEAFSPEVITKYWAPTREHPPLAKLLSALTISIFYNIAGLIASARLSVAICFSLLLISLFVLVRQFGSWKASLFSSLSLLIMPRFFGDAHLASLDVPMSLMSVLVVFSFIKGIKSWRGSLSCGLFFGLALATKLNALFLPFPLLLWAYLYHRKQYAHNLMAMLFLSPLVLLAIWPWLWVDTPQRLLEYLVLKVHRSPIPVYYLGKLYGEISPPWHYPFLMTAITIPSGLLLSTLVGAVSVIRSSFLPVPERQTGKGSGTEPSSLPVPERQTGLPGSSARDHEKLGMLIVFNALFPLLIMSLPLTPKYDGVRLFLPAFPFLAMLSGLGLEWLAEKTSILMGRKFCLRNIHPVRNDVSNGVHLPLILGLLFLGINAWPGAAIHPYQLSYYNALVGGVRGARKLGLETTYWGDSLTQTVLDYLNRQPPGTRVSFFPVGENVVALLKISGKLREDIEVVPLETTDTDFLVLNCRQGFFDERLWRIYLEKEPIKEASTFYRGVPLTAIYQLK